MREHERLRVLSVPSRHPYITAIHDPDRVTQVREGSPEQPWATSEIFRPGWVEAHADTFDMVHVHFGFEGVPIEEIEACLRALAVAGKPVITTVHDLENPQLDAAQQARFRAKLECFVRASERVTTLTTGAAQEIFHRWGVVAQVIEHPPLTAGRFHETGTRSTSSVRVGVLVKDARPSLSMRQLQHFCRAVDAWMSFGTRWEVSIVRQARLRDFGRDDAESRLDEISRLRSSEVTCQDLFSDAELESWISELDYLVLPYGHGTHSGLIELANDLGTRVLATPTGYLSEQRPGTNIFCWFDRTRDLASALDTMERRAAILPPSREILAARLGLVRRAHTELYARASPHAQHEHPRRRVLVIAAFRYPLVQPHHGGLESHVWNLVRDLRAGGADVTVAAPIGSDFTEGAPDELRYPRFVWPEGWPRTDTDLPPQITALEEQTFTRVMEYVRAHPGTYDVVHNHSLSPIPLALASRIDAPMVTTLHTPPVDALVAAARQSQSAFISVSRYTQDAWERRGIRSAVSQNGADSRDWPLGAGGRGLCWFGRIVPEKAPHLAALVARALHLPLRIAGPIGDPEYAERVLEPIIAESNGLVQYVGPLRQALLAQMVGESDVALITPQWDEPFGQVAAEALLCGTAVVGLDRGGLGEVFRDVPGVALAPRGDDAIAVAQLSQLVIAAAGAARNRSEIREHARARFDSRLTLTRTLEMYDALAQAHRARREAPQIEPVPQ